MKEQRAADRGARHLDLVAACALLLTAIILFAPGVLEAKIPAFRDMLGFTIPSRALWQRAPKQRARL